MQYRFVSEKENYEDYAAGRVLLAKSGATSFPVRLASEIFQRSIQFLSHNKQLHIYDPCCGSAYLLTVLGFLHGDSIEALYGSDVDSDMLNVATDNLNLLNPDGLESRRNTLERLASTYQKQTHHDALESVKRLAEKIPAKSIVCSTWQANAFEQSAKSQSVDLIICDVPYGDVTEWQALHGANDPLHYLLDAQYDVLRDGGIFALISDKKQKATHPRYMQVQHQTIGKRRFVLLQKN